MCSSNDAKANFGAGHDAWLLSGLGVKDLVLTGTRFCTAASHFLKGTPTQTQSISSLLCVSNSQHTIQSREERTSPVDKDKSRFQMYPRFHLFRVQPESPPDWSKPQLLKQKM